MLAWLKDNNSRKGVYIDEPGDRTTKFRSAFVQAQKKDAKINCFMATLSLRLFRVKTAAFTP